MVEYITENKAVDILKKVNEFAEKNRKKIKYFYVDYDGGFFGDNEILVLLASDKKAKKEFLGGLPSKRIEYGKIYRKRFKIKPVETRKKGYVAVKSLVSAIKKVLKKYFKYDSHLGAQTL